MLHINFVAIIFIYLREEDFIFPWGCNIFALPAPRMSLQTSPKLSGNPLQSTQHPRNLQPASSGESLMCKIQKASSLKRQPDLASQAGASLSKREVRGSINGWRLRLRRLMSCWALKIGSSIPFIRKWTRMKMKVVGQKKRRKMSLWKQTVNRSI